LAVLWITSKKENGEASFIAVFVGATCLDAPAQDFWSRALMHKVYSRSQSQFFLLFIGASAEPFTLLVSSRHSCSFLLALSESAMT
jgi:hypothetical protein